MAVCTLRSNRSVSHERWGAGLCQVARDTVRIVMGAVERKTCCGVVKEFYRENFVSVALLAAAVLELALVRIVGGVARRARLGTRTIQDDGVVEGRVLPRVGDVAVGTGLALVEVLVRVVGLVTVEAGLVRQRQGECGVTAPHVLVAGHAGRHHVGAIKRKDRFGVAGQVVWRGRPARF